MNWGHKKYRNSTPVQKKYEIPVFKVLDKKNNWKKGKTAFCNVDKWIFKRFSAVLINTIYLFSFFCVAINIFVLRWRNCLLCFAKVHKLFILKFYNI